MQRTERRHRKLTGGEFYQYFHQLAGRWRRRDFFYDFFMGF
jgi:hypothetical protein